MPKTLLVADIAESDARLSRILAGHELVFVRTLREAERALARQRIDLVAIGVHFDDSRMFDLLRREQDSGRPVVCMRTQQFESPAISLEGLRIAAKALGCALFVDFTQYPDDAGGDLAIRALFDGLLGG